MISVHAFFQNKTLFLTGGSRGIGRQIRQLFAKNGATVIAPGREELDLSDRESIRNYCEKHKDIEAGIFIHCAGRNELAGIEEIDTALAERVFQVNFYAALELLHILVPGMRRQKKGKILLISSLYALISRERRIAYSSSKSALTGLMRTLALELAGDQILVNAVAPGYVMTDMTTQNLSQAEIASISAQIPTGRFQTEDDIAQLAAFLCSDANRSITGQLIAVDGGLTCR